MLGFCFQHHHNVFIISPLYPDAKPKNNVSSAFTQNTDLGKNVLSFCMCYEYACVTTLDST